jgi:hypothetical protein
MAYLRERLALVTNAAPHQHVDTERSVNVDVLVGTARDRFQRELGTPNLCDYPEPSPCEVATSWYYYLHHLPVGWIGGGTVLFVHFDQSGRSDHVQWGLFK